MFPKNLKQGRHPGEPIIYDDDDEIDDIDENDDVDDDDDGDNNDVNDVFFFIDFKASTLACDLFNCKTQLML